jgi:hypothetical protein
MSKKGLDDYIQIVEQSHSKTAGANAPVIDKPLLTKLAEELVKEEKGAAAAGGAAVAAATAGAKPAGDGNVAAGAAPAVVAATEAATATQLALAGTDPAVPAAGMVAAVAKPQEPLIVGTGDGKVTEANALNKTPAAVAVAAEPTSKSDSAEKTSELKRAEEIGATMARSFTAELEKTAFDREYQESLAYLQERGVLEGYDIKA